MAKSLVRFAPRPVVIQMPRRRSIGRRAARFVGRRARRLVSRKSIPVAAGAIASGGLGWLVGSGKLDFLPEIGGSRMVTLGVAGYMLSRMSNNKYMKAAGTAAVYAAAFDFGRSQGGGTHGDDDWGWRE